jgi:hypothetical protein
LLKTKLGSSCVPVGQMSDEREQKPRGNLQNLQFHMRHRLTFNGRLAAACQVTEAWLAAAGRDLAFGGDGQDETGCGGDSVIFNCTGSYRNPAPQRHL